MMVLWGGLEQLIAEIGAVHRGEQAQHPRRDDGRQAGNLQTSLQPPAWGGKQLDVVPGESVP
jgi:hypothetical protein